MIKTIKKIIYTLHITSLLTLLTGCGGQKNENELIVGTCAGFPPYEMFDEHGAVVGFDIDVATKIAQQLGKKLIIKDMSFDALIIALKQGSVDMIVAGISITQSRLKEIALVHYSGQSLTTLPLIFWQHIPAGVKTVEDLNHHDNKTVCVQSGTLQEEVISSYKFLTIKQLENIPDLIMDIKYGKSIAAVLEPKVAHALIASNPEFTTIDIPLTPEQQDLGNGIGINKTNTQLIEKIKNIVAQLKQNGTLPSLEYKWFQEGNHGF